jgi:hypothetical protein
MSSGKQMAFILIATRWKKINGDGYNGSSSRAELLVN